MTGRARVTLLLLLVAAKLAGCASLPAAENVPPYVGADCITTAGQLVHVTGAMPGGWWWIKGDGPVWLVQSSHFARCL